MNVLIYALRAIYYSMQQLQVLSTDVVVVGKGCTAADICRAANVSLVAFSKCNFLSASDPLYSGMLLVLPPSGNLYTVQPGDDVITLCGSRERFLRLNGTPDFYPGRKVRI